MPAVFVDEEPQAHFVDDAGPAEGRAKFLEDLPAPTPPPIPVEQIRTILEPGVTEGKSAEQADIERANKIGAPQVELNKQSAPFNLREHLTLARERPSDKLQYWAQRIPWSPAGIIQPLEVKSAADRIQAGIGEPKDFEKLSDFIVSAERQQNAGVISKAVDIATALPAFAAEFSATGGAFTGTRAAAQRAGLAALEESAKAVAGKAARYVATKAAEAPAFIAGAAAQTLANPKLIAENFVQNELNRVKFKEGDQGQIETIIKDDDVGFAGNLRNSFLKAGFDIGTEYAGELLHPLKAAIAARWMNAVPGRTPGALQKALDASGWHGVLGEMFEERLNEFAAPLYGENYQPPSPQQLMAEALAFSVPGTAERLLSGRGPAIEKGKQNATTQRPEQPRTQRGETDAGIQPVGENRVNAPVEQPPRTPDSERNRVPPGEVAPQVETRPGAPVTTKAPLAVRILTARGVAPDVAEFVAARAGDKPANETAEDYRTRVNGLHDEFGFKVPTEVNPASSEASLRAAAAAEGFTEEQIQNTLAKAKAADTAVHAANTALIGRIQAARQPATVTPEPPKPQRVDVPGVGAVNIQYPAGSVRSGEDKAGDKWQVTMPAHYGDIVGTKGKDKDRIDIYVGPNAQAPGPVYVVNQYNPETGKFDEHKVMAGFPSLPDATAAYDAAFSDGSGPARRQSVQTFSPEQFQTWLKEGDHSKPAGGERIDLQPPPKLVTKPVAPATKPPVPETKAPIPATIPPVGATKPPVGETQAPKSVTGETQPISPPAAPPAGAPPVVDVTAKPSATRAPEAAAVTQAKLDDIRKRREAIQAKLRKKLGQTNISVDPEIATLVAELAVNYTEEGVVRFADFARRVKEELPDIWERLKHYLGGAWRTAGEQNMELDEVTREQGKAAIQALEAETPLPKEEGVKSPEVQPTKKEGEENTEVGIIQDAHRVAQNATDPLRAYRELVRLYSEQPRLGTRTVTSKTNQAYSTPPPLAYLAGRLADLRNGKVIAEPTAGNGMLLIETNPTARLLANELDADRADRLRKSFPRADISQMDASTEDFHNYLDGWSPDRVIANPPFGGVIEEGTSQTKRFPIINASTKKGETPSIDLAIALNSLDAMTQDGKAVIIIGSKTGSMAANFGSDAARAQAYRRPEMLEFFRRFNVKDWFTVSGDLYKKMGAGWPVDVIVIDGKTPTPLPSEGGLQRPWITPPPVFNSWHDLEGKLNDAQLQPTREPSPTPGGSSGAESAGAGQGGPAVRPGGTQSPRPPLGNEPTVPAPGRPQEPTRPGIPTGRPAVVPESRPELPTGGGGLGQASAEGSAEINPGMARLVEGKVVLNVPYRSVSKNADPKLVVPANIADSMQRAVRQLEIDVGKPVDEYLAEKMKWTREELFKRLSSAQIEAVALFVRNSENRGTGLINSDQTGVGKGRTVASVMDYAPKVGKIPIFITQGKHLYTDMAGRDLPSIGNKKFRPFITDSDYEYENGEGTSISDKPGAAAQREAMEEIARTGKLPPGVHGIFTTYYQLQADKPQGYSETPQARARRKRRLTARPDGPRLAMLRALAPNAIFVLDEAHQAAGIDSDVGLSLQSILPNAAGVYYSSATFAKRPDNLTLYAIGTALRLAGLSRTEMTELFKSGGVPMQQALTSMLAEEGEFVRREQDMSGVKFDFTPVSSSPEEEAQSADTYTSFLRDLHDIADQVNAAAAGFVDDVNQTRPDEAQVDLSGVNFGSRLFNLSNQYLFSLRSDATANEAIAALKRGQKPFVAVFNTMAGPIANLHEMGLPLDFGGLLRREMAKMLEVTIRDPLEDSGKRVVILKPEDLPDGGAKYRQIEEQIKATDFGSMPISPIDAIKKKIQQAGYSIGEITARDGELTEEGGVVKISKRDRSTRNRILHEYNNADVKGGKAVTGLDALIVNGSGSTGLSAHTDPKFRDQRQRYMIVAQAAPDINVFMQMIGRVMRFGQTSLPAYKVLMTNLAAEKRFMTMLRGKLTSLNANTSAETESGITQGGLADDVFNAIGDEVVGEVMLAHPDLAQLARIPLPNPMEADSFENFARYATGRFVLLPNDDAARLWRDISEIYDARIRALDEAGENPLKANVQDLRAKTTGIAEIVPGTGSTAFDGPVKLERIDIKPAKKPYTHEQAVAESEKNSDENEKAAEEWFAKQATAMRERIETMEKREAKQEQIDRTRQTLQAVYETVTAASRLLGQTVGVDPGGTGHPLFYAVPIALELKSRDQSDFSSNSKHTLKLATNTLRRTIHLPLSQLNSLKLVEESDPAEQFDNNSESTSTRYVATGNLLKGYAAAKGMSAHITKPAVTMYSTRRGALKTGVLLGAAFNPSTGVAGGRAAVNKPDDFATLMDRRTPMAAGPVEITGTIVTVPSGTSTRNIWGDRTFQNFFQQSPVERAGQFRGVMDRRMAFDFFRYLASKGLSIVEKQSEGTTRAIEFAEPPPETTASDVANKIADALGNLKSGQEPGQLHLFGVIPAVWDKAIEIAQGIIRAGGKVADAVAKAIEYIRANHKGDWDEAGARGALESASQGKPATEEGLTEPAEGEQPPVVDDHWVPTQVKGMTWYVRDRDKLSPESTARSIDAAEAAFTQAGLKSERRTMFDTGDSQTKSILFIPETENADEKGRKLAEVLEREIATQREAGKGADHVSTLINSVREGFDQPGSAFRQMSQQVRNRLFALAQEEASWRGRALRALANSKADIIRIARNVDVYLQRIYSTAFADKAPGAPAGASDIADDLRASLREVLTDEEIDRLPELIADPAQRERIKAALKKALEKVAPKGAKRFGRRNWRTIESLIQGGILDDTEWFKELARKRGWKVPTDAEIEQMRKLADEEQALRKPTDAELAKVGEDPKARERLLADIEAATRETRFKLQKRLAVMWSEMTKPVSLRDYWAQRQNNARFLNELMTANLLFRASFVSKQAIDVATQWFWRMPMRAVAQALTLRKNDLAAGKQVRFWDDAQAALKDIYGDSIKSLKVATAKARAALAGRVEIRNVDRLMGSVSALDRLWLRADRAAEDGRNAEAFMWRAVAAIGFSYKVAGAFDYLHGTPAEWNERRFRVIEALRETGVDAAAARVQADWVMDGALAEYPEAVAMTRSMLEARGIPFTEQQLREDAWNMVERRQYQRIGDLGLPVDAIREQSDLYRNTLGWNEREMRGPGGLVGTLVHGVGAIGEGIGIPLAMGRFGNAIAIGINRQLHKTPLYALANIRLPFLRGGQESSPWSRTMTDIYERRLEAVAGTMLGSTMLTLAAAGLLKVWLKPPPDKEERELWEREGHKAGTVEIPMGDGKYQVWSLTAGPFALVAPYLAAGGAINDLTVKREKQQAKLNAEAAKKGLTPAQLPPPDISDWFGVAAQAAQASVLGNRTASGWFNSITDYGTPNVKKFVASQFTPMVPGLPALQEVSRMAGVIIDPKKADVMDFLVPLPTSKARKYNMLGDPVGTQDDLQRVVQTLTGGTYPSISPGQAHEADAYKALFATGYRPPSIDPNAGHAIGGDFRPFTESELERYTAARSRNLREELGRLGPTADAKDAREAYQRANDAALRETGVTVATRTTTPSGATVTRAASSRGGVGVPTRTTEARSGTGGRAARGLSRGLRGVRFGRRGLARASRIRLQPRLGRGRARGLRGLSRARVSSARV